MRSALTILVIVAALHFAGNALGVYDMQIEAGFVWFDNVLHALVGLAVAVFFFDLIAERYPERSFWPRALMSLAGVLVVAVLWELVEFGIYAAFPAYATDLNIYSPSVTEAMIDVVSNVIGGILLVTWRTGQDWNRQTMSR